MSLSLGHVTVELTEQLIVACAKASAPMLYA